MGEKPVLTLSAIKTNHLRIMHGFGQINIVQCVLGKHKTKNSQLDQLKCQSTWHILYSQLSNKSTVGNKSTATPKFLFQAIVPLK